MTAATEALAILTNNQPGIALFNEWMDFLKPKRVVMNAALVAWSNMPGPAATAFKGYVKALTRIVNLEHRQEVRFSSVAMEVIGATGATIVAMYSIDAGATWNYFDSDGADSGPSCAIEAVGLFDTAFIAIDDAAKTSTTWVALFGVGGDGAADPQFGTIELEFK